MSNQVLALKYRPSKFEDLIGQDSISETLSLALDKNRLSHAYLFSGLRGSGKTSTARIMAKALVCKNAPTSKPCEVCDSCLSANSGRHLDIVEMDAASNRGIDDIKVLIEHTKYRPTSAKYKVFIIDEVHMLTTQAFNALLKTLEEPPAFVKFILATTDPLKLPATILSRTQHFRFKKIPEKDVFHHLVHILNLENITYENEALNILIRSGQGSLRDTLTLLDQAIIYSKSGVSTTAVTDMMGLIDPAFMDKMFDTILKNGDTNDILNELESYEAGQVIDEISIYLKHKMLTRDPRFDIYLFDRYFRILGDAKQLLAQNSDGGFVLILTLMKLVEAKKLKTIDAMIEEIENSQIIESIQYSPTSQLSQPIQEDTHQKQQVEKTTLQQEEINILKKEVEEISPSLNKISKDEQLTKQNYQRVTDMIYDRSYELGECFKNSFLLRSYDGQNLTIDSCASDECRVILKKNFAYIRGFIEDVFGLDTQIHFNKIEQPKKDLPQSIILQEEESTGSMIEEIELGSSGCVAGMGVQNSPTLSQKELNIEDILNSQFVNKAIELFQPESQVRITSKL
ncbi:MAG: DNA polymerase III subunit gamma/tau [Epsilonproteobacteria bacterium]|nr:DNA polymerase III subunit gamma/tau [Campylobacterota bacterium]